MNIIFENYNLVGLSQTSWKKVVWIIILCYWKHRLFSESPISEIIMHRKYTDVTNVGMLHVKMSVKMSAFIPQNITFVRCCSVEWQMFIWGLSGEMSHFPSGCKVCYKVCNSKLVHVTDKHKMANIQRERFEKTL